MEIIDTDHFQEEYVCGEGLVKFEYIHIYTLFHKILLENVSVFSILKKKGLANQRWCLAWMQFVWLNLVYTWYISFEFIGYGYMPLDLNVSFGPDITSNKS